MCPRSPAGCSRGSAPGCAKSSNHPPARPSAPDPSKELLMAKIPENVLGALAQIPVFSGCTRKELQTVAHLGTPITVEPGYVFTRQGVRGFEFFINLDGTASCTIDGRRVADLDAGDVFGEMGLLEHEP